MKKAGVFAAGLLAGSLLMTAIPAAGAAVKQYVLQEAVYPIIVNGLSYNGKEPPVLNLDGVTYIPLRAVGSILGADVGWNAGLKRVEISNGKETLRENNAFRKIAVSGSGGTYTVTGEARVFEAVMNYAVSDGSRYVLEEYRMLNEGAPAWSAFTLKITVPARDRPANGTLTLELFEYSAKDGSQVNLVQIPLEKFGA